MSEFEGYMSPFSWRYSSPEMRQIWSEANKRLLWRKIWVNLARAEGNFGLVSPIQLADLETHEKDLDIQRSLEIEEDIQHDLMAELKVFASQCPKGGGILHLGATSSDIEDNTDAIRLRQSTELLVHKLGSLLTHLAERLEQWADIPTTGFTHLQPAEPTTVGYRFSVYARDLLDDWLILKEKYRNIRGKGFKGAVGTAASYIEMIGFEKFEEFEDTLSRLLELPFFPLTGQTYPRKQDLEVINILAGIGASLNKMAFDLRLLQSPLAGEFSEAFGSQQIGSSAMPFKRNPIRAEKIDSLARSLSMMPAAAWNNASLSLLERTLDDSANRRSLLPEAFLTCDEIISTATSVITGLKINLQAVRRNLSNYAPFACTERLLMHLVQSGADRQKMHARLRDASLLAWQAMQEGKTNPLLAILLADPEYRRYLPLEEMKSLLNVEAYTGIAPTRAKEMAARIRQTISPK